MYATKFASAIKYENHEEPKFQYRAGDKYEEWSLVTGPRTCDVLGTTFNPYSPTPLLGKYIIRCPGDIEPRTITDEDLKRSDVYKEAFLKENPVRRPASK